MNNNLRRYLSAYVEELQHRINILNRRKCNSFELCIVDRNKSQDEYDILFEVALNLKKMLKKDEDNI